MFTDSPLLLTLQLKTNFSELVGRLSTDLGDDEVRDDAVWQVVDSLQRWWEATRPTPDLGPPLSLKLPEAGTLQEAASMLVDPFGAFLAQRLAGPLSPSNAARLTIAAHIGGFAIHLWRHWKNIYEMRCVAELAGHVPSELIACAIGRADHVPATALRGYLPETPNFSRKYRNPVRIGWDTGHHVAFLCAERGWFGNIEGRPMSSPENGAMDEADLNVAPSASTTEASES
jgi:hypothetical protein